MKGFLLILLGLSGCTMVSYDRVFPKLDWYWSSEAKAQRESRKQLLNQIQHQQELLSKFKGSPELTTGILAKISDLYMQLADQNTP